MAEAPHVDAVSGQAAWVLAQALAMHLVKAGVLPKSAIREAIQAYQKQAKVDPLMNPTQRAAAHLLGDLATFLQTADQSDSH